MPQGRGCTSERQCRYLFAAEARGELAKVALRKARKRERKPGKDGPGLFG